jgi:hypothetical protein
MSDQYEYPSYIAQVPRDMTWKDINEFMQYFSSKPFQSSNYGVVHTSNHRLFQIKYNNIPFQNSYKVLPETIYEHVQTTTTTTIKNRPPREYPIFMKLDEFPQSPVMITPEKDGFETCDKYHCYRRINKWSIRSFPSINPNINPTYDSCFDPTTNESTDTTTIWPFMAMIEIVFFDSWNIRDVIKTIRRFEKQGFGIVHYWSYYKSIMQYNSSYKNLHTHFSKRTRLYEDLGEESQFVYFAPTTTTTT